MQLVSSRARVESRQSWISGGTPVSSLLSYLIHPRHLRELYILFLSFSYIFLNFWISGEFWLVELNLVNVCYMDWILYWPKGEDRMYEQLKSVPGFLKTILPPCSNPSVILLHLTFIPGCSYLNRGYKSIFCTVFLYFKLFDVSYQIILVEQKLVLRT